MSENRPPKRVKTATERASQGTCVPSGFSSSQGAAASSSQSSWGSDLPSSARDLLEPSHSDIKKEKNEENEEAEAGLFFQFLLGEFRFATSYVHVFSHIGRS